MSRSYKDGRKKGGHRNYKELWSRRPLSNNSWGITSCRWSKTLTHHLERIVNKNITNQELEFFYEECSLMDWWDGKGYIIEYPNIEGETLTYVEYLEGEEDL